MHRSLVTLVAFSVLLGCSKSRAPQEEEATPEATAVATDKTIAPSPIPTPPKAPPKDAYPKKPEPNVHGAVEHLARLSGNSDPLHNVAVLGQYAYVDDSAGMIHRVKIAGGELEVVHDSDDGAGVHASRPTRVADTMYFTIDGQEDDTTILSKVVDGKAVTVAKAPEILYLTGDDTNLFATVFQKDDFYRLGTDGFEPFVKTPDPGAPTIVGDHLYWTSYRRGGVHRVLLDGKKKQRLAKNRKTIGLAVIGDTAYYGTESDGGVHAVPTSGGASKLLLDGFNNHDEFIADEGGVYFWTWGTPSAVLRLDAKTRQVETLIYGLDAPRGLAIQDGWLYVVGGRDLFRVKTSARMPWPLVAE
jgi:hypothetical protein